MTTPIRRHRKTRIIATLGPASNSAKIIEALFNAGADTFRLNMSHGDHAGKAALVKAIRRVEKRVGRPIGIIADLQGPKIRIGKFKGGKATLRAGAVFRLDMVKKQGDAKRVTLPHPEVFEILKPGHQVLLDDGKVRLEVLEKSKNTVDCKVLVGGRLSDRKGVNIPDAVLPLAALTEKDRVDLDFALQQKVDWVALSFVQRPDDVAEVRKIVRNRAGVLAKIEKPAALTRLAEIIEISDAVMVARGDLGVEAPLEEVPTLQRRIIAAAREAGKPVVVATQMLESMITAPMPTRAEVSDVATAVYDGADAIMLSAETAAGKFPIEAVAMMDRVARKVGSDPNFRISPIDERAGPTATTADAISAGARQVAATLKAGAIVTFTTSGATAIRASRERPVPPILVLTPSTRTARRLALVWGLHTVKTKDVTGFEEMIGKSRRMALRHGLAGAGERIVVTAGVPFGTPGATNVLHITWVTGDELDNGEED
jgi:pyruvate kinase